jgi:hypothetical protein
VSTLINSTELREISLGRYVQGKTSTFVAGGGTHQLFTIAGGEVLITGLWGKVTTSITLDNHALTLQMDPTTGDTVALTEATIVGTTDTVAGDILGFVTSIDDPATNGALAEKSIKVYGEPLRFIGTTGEIELVDSNETGTEVGVVQWFCTYVPLTAGASVVASA